MEGDEGRRARVRLWLPRIAAGGVPLAVYLSTLCRTIGPGDAAELATSGALLGVPHPTGYPLYTLLSRLVVAFVPVGSAAARVNLVSALSGAVAVLLLFEILRRITASVPAALAGAWALAFARAWWLASVTAEVYTLNALFLLLLVHLGFRVRERRTVGDLCLLSYVFGLSLTHHLTIALAVPFLAFAAWPVVRRRPRALALAFLAALAALTAYAYIPVRAALDPPYVFGNPTGWGGLWRHVTGAGYAGNLLPAGFESVTGALRFYPRHMAEGIPYFLLWLPAFGLVDVYRRRSSWAPGLLLAVPFAALPLVYSIPDPSGYFLPLHLGVAALTAAGFVTVVRFLFGMDRRAARTVSWGLLAASTASLLAFNLPLCDRSSHRLAEAYGRGLLETADELAAGEPHLFLLGDHALFPVLYLQRVENVSPRVRVHDQSETILEDFRGERGSGRRAPSPEERAATERSVVEEHPGSVFFTQAERPPVGVGAPLRPAGLLFEARAEARQTDRMERLWASYGFPDMADPHLYGDIGSRVIGGLYYQQRARMDLDGGQVSYAREALDAAGRVAYDVAPVHARQVPLFLAVGDRAGALEAARTAVRLAPGSPIAENNLGNLHTMDARWEEAEATYRRALRRAPDLAILHSNLAAAYAGMGRLEEATGELERALDLDPGLTNARYNLALVLAWRGDRDRALEVLAASPAEGRDPDPCRALAELLGKGLDPGPQHRMRLSFGF